MRDNTGDKKPIVEEVVNTGRGLFKFVVQRQASQGYGVQIGVFAEYGNVLIQAEKLQNQFNLPIVVNINELRGKTIYRVCVGHFNTKNEANFQRLKMKNDGVAGFVKNFSTLR